MCNVKTNIKLTVTHEHHIVIVMDYEDAVALKEELIELTGIHKTFDTVESLYPQICELQSLLDAELP